MEVKLQWTDYRIQEPFFFVTKGVFPEKDKILIHSLIIDPDIIVEKKGAVPKGWSLFLYYGLRL